MDFGDTQKQIKTISKSYQSNDIDSLYLLLKIATMKFK